MDMHNIVNAILNSVINTVIGFNVNTLKLPEIHFN